MGKPTQEQMAAALGLSGAMPQEKASPSETSTAKEPKAPSAQASVSIDALKTKRPKVIISASIDADLADDFARFCAKYDLKRSRCVEAWIAEGIRAAERNQ